ncbi:MAG: prenyltransferase/squalene oxidase repeat-containing protein [Bryobacteraceae bacterium]
MDVSSLLTWQNTDGGWGYHRGGSTTEPTTFALLALSVSGCGQTVAAERAVQWLAASQRSDGGWPPSRDVKQSTWVTALALILPKTMRAQLRINRAKEWILSQQGRESRWRQRLSNYLLGDQNPLDTAQEGWPFYPDAAAWVAPTALTILALERFRWDSHAQSRCSLGRAFLLSRMCQDGGWNHGSFRALGYDLDSYPETTGLALLALHKEKTLREESLARAELQLSEVRSREATCWLQLGLLAHARSASSKRNDLRPARSVMEVALTILADAAASGNNAFVTSDETA